MRRVVVTGFGVVSPIGVGRTEFFSGLADGRPGIDEIRSFEAQGFPTRIAGEVKQPLALPDWVNEEFRPGIARDPKSTFAVVAAEEALTDAFGDCLPDRWYRAERVAAWLAAGLEIFLLEDVVPHVRGRKLDGAAVLQDMQSAPAGSRMQIPAHLAARAVALRAGVGTLCSVNLSACAAGSQAVGEAFLAIRDGFCDMAICGGYDSMVTPLGVGGFCKLEALSVSNHLLGQASRPFDQRRDGFVLGEGSGMLVLEEYESAYSRGAHMHAEVLGYGTSLDAFHVADPDPENRGAQKAMRLALKRAGLLPAQIDYINAHGTATRKNDPAESRAIRRVFEDVADRVPVSSTKSQTGHLIGAAGAVEFIAGLFALDGQVLPATVNLEQPDPACDLNHVMGKPRPARVECFLSNSFGFGGQNATLVAGLAPGGRGRME